MDYRPLNARTFDMMIDPYCLDRNVLTLWECTDDGVFWTDSEIGKAWQQRSPEDTRTLEEFARDEYEAT